MPTPLEHYETAEELLERAAGRSLDVDRELDYRAAQAHATLAAVPWARDDADEVAAGLDRDQVAALVDVVQTLAEWCRTVPPVNPDDPHAEARVETTTDLKGTVAALVDPVLTEVLDR